MLPEPLPEDLQRYLDERAIILEKALQNRQFDEAYEGYEELNGKLLAEQPPGKRYHKGYPLHNMGYAALLKGDAQRALPLFIAAYIEDLLSQPIGEEDNADAAPAGTVLARVYQATPSFFHALKEAVRGRKRAGTVIRNPQEIVQESIRSPHSQTRA